MEQFFEYFFRFFGYVIFGFFLEIFYAVVGIEKAVGAKIPRRVPPKYLEGFVSLYMIPIHGFGMLFGFEVLHAAIADWFILARFAIWAILISGIEVLGGYIYDKLFGFYSWDYYALSPYKVFKRGYTLWTLIPQWGLAGLIMEIFSGLMVHLSPQAGSYLANLIK